MEEELPEEPQKVAESPVDLVDSSAVESHILFHKALIGEEEDPERLNRYLEIINDLKEGRLTIKDDPYDKAIAIAFELVIINEMNPWDIDLATFALQYLDRVREDPQINLVTAGRIIFMAWSILKLQSDKCRSNAEKLEEEDLEEMFEPSPSDWLADDLDFMFTTTVIRRKKPPIREMVWRKGKRPVTLLELVGAFEEAKEEARIQQILNQRRKELIERNRSLRKDMLRDKVHKEDLEADIALVWQRINQFNGHPIRLADIHDPSPDDLVMTLVSSLFLAKSGKIDLWQEQFPFGDIFVQNLDALAEEELERLRVQRQRVHQAREGRKMEKIGREKKKTRLRKRGTIEKPEMESTEYRVPQRPLPDT